MLKNRKLQAIVYKYDELDQAVYLYAVRSSAPLFFYISLTRSLYQSIKSLCHEHSILDVYTHYEYSMRYVQDVFAQNSLPANEFLVLCTRLRENIDASRRYGDNENRRAERAEVIDRLNAAVYRDLDTSFTEMCESTREAISLGTIGGVSERTQSFIKREIKRYFGEIDMMNVDFLAVPFSERREFMGRGGDYRESVAFSVQEELLHFSESGLRAPLLLNQFSRNYKDLDFVAMEAVEMFEKISLWLDDIETRTI